MVGDTQLVMPNIVDAYNQGAAQGRADRTRRTLSQYLQPALGGDQGALAQIYQADPQAGIQTQNEAFQQQQQGFHQQQQAQLADQQTKQFADADLQRLGQHARLIANAAQSGNMPLAQSIYASIYPEASKILGASLPQTLTPDQLPNIQKLADTVSPLPQNKPEFQSAIPTGQLDASGQPITQAGWVQYGKPFQPLQGPGSVATSTPPQSSSPVSGGALVSAVRGQESGGNMNAISPKGAISDMQVMPATAANPGFGITPSNGTLQDTSRVGREYLTALGNKYGGDTSLTLAAYNAGPGRVDQALQAAGGDPTKALASLPAETQAYVPGVESRMGGSPSAQPLAFGQSSKAGTKQSAPSGYRFKADGALEAIPGGPADKTSASQPVGDTSKTGDAFLASLGDPGLAAQIQGIAEGRFPMPKVSRPSKAGEVGPEQIQQAVAQYDPTYDQADPSSRIKARAYFTTGKGSEQSRSLNTFIGHLALLADSADKLDNGKSQLANTVENALGKQFNSTKATNFDAAAEPVASEFATLLKGGVPAQPEIEAQKAQLNTSRTPDQLHGTIGTMAEQALSRLQALDKQKQQALGPFASKVTILDQSGRDALDKLRKRGLIGDFNVDNQPSAQPAQPAQPAPPSQPAHGWSIQLVQQ